MDGSTSEVSIVEVKRPPMTTVARGRWISAPGVVARAMGMKPRPATSAVIRIGRSRTIAASRAASWGSKPFCLRCSTALIQTRPLSTATPKSAMKPTAAEIENGSPRRISANTPPVAAIGTAR